MANTQAHGPARSSLDQGAPLIRLICQIAGARSLIDDARVGLARPGVIAAVQRHDTPAIFNWLIDALSYQGVSDSIAYGYMEQHGADPVARHRRHTRRSAELPEAQGLLAVRGLREPEEHRYL